ncbi:MAG TPA: hypothetical protein VEI48_04415, partial [Candidatus Sulfotelmatobacter sp.]|nr:hypothetical protein [Candidatus Sulfotelmatobacter sp.]
MITLVERPMTPEDLAACITVFYAATDELYGRWNQPNLPRDPETTSRLMAYLAFSDGGRAWVAGPADGPPCAFGVAIEREASWFLSFLFIEPGQQARGVGRRLLDRLAPPAGRASAGDGALCHTCVDSLQPISTGLYATMGLLPRVPVYVLLGHLREGHLPSLPPGVVATPYQARPTTTRVMAGSPVEPSELPTDLLAELEAVDRPVLGWRRRLDHRRFLADGRLLVRYRGRDGAPLGYGYVHASGRVGPVAARQPALLGALLGDLLKRLTPAGAWRVLVPGPSPCLAPLIG